MTRIFPYIIVKIKYIFIVYVFSFIKVKTIRLRAARTLTLIVYRKISPSYIVIVLCIDALSEYRLSANFSSTLLAKNTY